jgi:molecular chaperone DnaK
MPNYGSLDPGYYGLKGHFMNRKGVIESLRDARGGNFWPSYVAKTSDGKTLIGHAARNHGVQNPTQVAHAWKEFLGDDTKRYFNGTAPAAEALAMMLIIAVASMEKQSGFKFDGYVMLCPANYTEAQRRGLFEACRIAGIRVVQLITEPAGAAYAYCIRDDAGVGRNSLIACADLGHGTFDFSMLHVTGSEAIPIATDGIPLLGGRNFTDICEKLIVEKVSKELGKPMVKEKLSPPIAAQLREKAETLKHDLAGQTSVTVPVHFAGQSLTVEISQKEYETASEPLLKQMFACIDKTMKESGKTFKDLESFVLAGGPFNSVRMQELVANHTGLVPRVECDPSTVVSYGAVLHALNLAHEAGGQVSIPEGPSLKESITYHIGIAVVDEASPDHQKKCAVIVKKHTRLPHKHTDTYRLARANQDVAMLEVWQGEDGAPAAKCQRMAGFELHGLKPDVQRAPRISVTFDIDLNGLLTVTAKDGNEGPSGSVVLQVEKK